MPRRTASVLLPVLVAFALSARAADKPKLVEAQDGSGVVGYKDTPVQPWSGYHTHDPDRPAPKVVDAGPGPEKPAPPPADAIVLFDGKDTSKWNGIENWKLEDGLLVAGKGLLTTKDSFGDCQLHVEWMAPDPPVGVPFDRGNNGVMMMGMTEIQIFDSFNQPGSTKLYPDGQAASVYAQTPPLANATRKPGQWQTYDIVWTAPIYKDGKMTQPARVTMLHNGVLVHLDQEVYGTTPHRGLAKYPDQRTQGPISLMGHNNPVKFRNIWVRKLDLPKEGKDAPKDAAKEAPKAQP